MVADLRFFAEQEGAGLIAAFPTIGSDASKVGRGSVAYHDADHYGIAIPAATVTDIEDVAAAAPARRSPKP